MQRSSGELTSHIQPQALYGERSAPGRVHIIRSPSTHRTIARWQAAVEGAAAALPASPLRAAVTVYSSDLGRYTAVQAPEPPRRWWWELSCPLDGACGEERGRRG